MVQSEQDLGVQVQVDWEATFHSNLPRCVLRNFSNDRLTIHATGCLPFKAGGKFVAKEKSLEIIQEGIKAYNSGTTKEDVKSMIAFRWQCGFVFLLLVVAPQVF